MYQTIFCLSLFLISGFIQAKNTPQLNADGQLVFSAAGERITLDSTTQNATKVDLKNGSLAGVFPGRTAWVWQDLGEDIGRSILAAKDINQDGQLELILGANGQGFGAAQSVVVMNFDLSRIMCSVDMSPMPLDFHVSQWDTDAALELTLVSNNAIKVIDGRTCDIEMQHDFVEQVQTAALGDTNNDQIPDVVYSRNGHLYIAAINDMSNFQTRLGFGGNRIIVESTGNSLGDDIGVYNQTHTVLNGRDMSTIAEIFDLNSSFFQFGDFNGDQSYEVLSTRRSQSNDTLITAINISTAVTVVEFEPLGRSYFDVVLAQDVNGDGSHEILTGDDQWGDVRVFAGDGTELLSVDNPSHGVTNVLVVDLDQNQALDVFFGAGHSSSGSDFLYRADYQSQQMVWRSPLFAGPYYVSQGLVNDQLALNMSTANNDLLREGHFTINASQGQPSDLAIIPDGFWDNTDMADIGQISSGGTEITCGVKTSGFNNNKLECFELENETELWSRNFTNGSVNYLRFMQLDNDPTFELLLVNSNGDAFAYEVENGFLKWQSENNLTLGTYRGIRNIQLVNNEIWLLRNQELLRLNPTNGMEISIQADTGLTAIDVVNNQVYAAVENEGFGILNTTDLSLSEVLFFESQSIHYLDVADDEQAAFLSVGANNSFPNDIAVPNMDVTLVSLNNAFMPWVVGEKSINSTNFPSWRTLYYSDMGGLKKLDMSVLIDVIFSDDFEQ